MSGAIDSVRAARKHLKTMTTAAVRSLDDRGWVLAGDFGLRLLRVVLLLSLWRTVLPETGATSGMTRAAVLWPLAHLMWTGNRERLVTHGG